MRIAIDARLVSYAVGGISQYTIRLVRALAATSTDDEILVLESQKAGPGTPWPDAVRQVKLITPPHNRLEQITLPMELLRVPADLLHSPDFIPPFRRRCRSVITIHDLAFLRFPHLLMAESARYYGQVDRAVRSAEQIVAVSYSTRQDLLDLLEVDPQKITVIYSAAAPECRPLDPAEAQERRAQLDLPERFILFVGTLEPRKNLPTLLEALPRVWKEHRIPLVVVGGKGWLYESVYMTLDRLRLTEEQVHLVGAIPSQQLAYYYGCASCLVMPSLYEGFGLPALEAMACGTPVVVSNVSSLPEIVGDAGLLVDPEDVEGLADTLIRLLSDEKLRRRLGQLGIQRAATFSWERTARETLAVYRRAVEAGP